MSDLAMARQAEVAGSLYLRAARRLFAAGQLKRGQFMVGKSNRLYGHAWLLRHVARGAVVFNGLPWRVA
jgi:hypothetical protein